MLSSLDKEKIQGFIHEKSRICLQFPDELLAQSSAIVKEIEKLSKNTIALYVMADTTFGSCCVDKVAAEHGNADGIIHFGDACLSKPSSDSVPVLWIFAQVPCNMENLISALANRPKSSITIVMSDTASSESLLQAQATCDCKELIFSKIMSQWTNKDDLKLGNNQYDVFGRFFELPSGISSADTDLFFIGNSALTLSNLTLTLNPKNVFSFDPETGTTTEHNGQASSSIRRRFTLVQKAKVANTIGIVVGTLGVSQYRDIIEGIKKLILSSGKKPYLLAVGKPNPAKLGNFLEIDAFCLIACPENSLLDSREYMNPIITPYELVLALNPSYIWSPCQYDFNLESILPKIHNSIQIQESPENDGDSDEEPVFSLVTGTYSMNKRFTKSVSLEPNSSDDALVKRWDGQISRFISTSAGAEFLKSRSYQGLDPTVHDSFSHLEVGREGIARGYRNEE